MPTVSVPAGKFLMGSPTSERDREPRESQNEVSVDAFWMDPTEVTNAAFRKFLVANRSWQKSQVKSDFASEDYLKYWKNAEYPSIEQGNYPVTYVSWYAAQAYCAWMEKRLPTEAEWEYAARAGTTKAYWWGDEWEPAKAAGNLPRGPDPVGKEAHRNQWNLFDMLGNVKEWTSTVYKTYPYDASDGREDPQSVSGRVVRGGSWADVPEYLRSAFRIQEAPNFTDGFVGFRCASSSGKAVNK
jgi:formylglycine-generating enzyme required for sulfatase activity